MPIYCCIKSCKSNSVRNRGLRYYEIPKIWTRTPELRKLSEERVNKWHVAINRRHIKPRSSRVCSKHFHSGKCAHLSDHLNPDWVPSLNLDIHNADTTISSSSEDDDDMMEIGRPENQEEFLEEHLNETQPNEETTATSIQAIQIKPISCCVPNCKNVRSSQQKDIKFFRFPSAKEKINGKIIRHSERLNAWIKAINRIDITHLNAKYKIICCEHFQSGAPSIADDKSLVDWVPNQKLPSTLTKPLLRTSSSSKVNKIPKFKPRNSLETVDPLAEDEIQMQVGLSGIKMLPNFEAEDLKKEIHQLKSENELLKRKLAEKDSIIANENTKHLRLVETHSLILKDKDATMQLLEQKNLKISLSRESFKSDDKKVNYFTGLPSYAVLEIIYDFLEEHLVCCLKKGINKFDAFILVLIKLRLDLPLTYMGYRYGIAGNTTSIIFHSNLKILSEKIGPFIRWPEKNALRENTSVYFKKVLGNKFTALLDFIEDPGPNVSQETSLQKKYMKYKYLVAISPAGAIIFVSKGYDCNLSVKEIAESCGVLDYTEDGDIILSDHGLFTHQVYSYNGSKVLVQSSNNEEIDLLDTLLQNPMQLDPDVKPEADSCRIYLQQSIVNLMNKFFVLSNKYKVGLLKSYKTDEGERYFDYVIRVCCALTNVSPALLSFEAKKS